MQRALGKPIVIENIGGAGGMLAAAKAAHSEPDGYTILLHQNALAAGMTLYPDRTFDAEKDFVTIGLVNTTINTLAGRPTLPPNNFDELLHWMKQPGQTIKVGHPGVGSFGHLGEVLIFQELGVKVIQVPYRGAGPALIDLLAGQVDLGPISAVVAQPLINGGKLKAYKRGVVPALGYLLAHEGHHRGSILLTLKQCGHKVSTDVQYGIWEWNKI